MSFADNYFARHRPFVQRIAEAPRGLLSYLVVIPVYLEDEIAETLQSLHEALPPSKPVEVITVVNFPENDSPENKERNLRSYDAIKKMSNRFSDKNLQFHTLFAPDLPVKHAGAGLARKIGMDEAVYRFNQCGNASGFILSLDADTLVDRNYFTSLEEAECEAPHAGGCLYQFAHPCEGDRFEYPVYEAIIRYELHMRYYRHALASTGFPWAEYTLGSNFGVRAGVYAKMGGMNRRKAGEDFYFLNKLYPHVPFLQIRNSTVYPSPRPSLRVPFGTGPVITRALKGIPVMSYAPEAFERLGELFSLVPGLYQVHGKELEKRISGLHSSVLEFLKMSNFNRHLEELHQNTASSGSFQKRFFQWFDSFKIVRFLNRVHESDLHRLPVEQAVVEWFGIRGIRPQGNSALEYLNYFREMDRLRTE